MTIDREAGLGHNSLGGEAAQHLRALARRIQRLDAEIIARNADKSAIYREAKALGFDPHGLRVALRWMRDPTASGERDAVTKLYVNALLAGAEAQDGTEVAARARGQRGAP